MKNVFHELENATYHIFYNLLIDHHLKYRNFEALAKLQTGDWKQNTISEHVIHWVWVRKDHLGDYFVSREMYQQFLEQVRVMMINPENFHSMQNPAYFQEMKMNQITDEYLKNKDNVFNFMPNHNEKINKI